MPILYAEFKGCFLRKEVTKRFGQNEYYVIELGKILGTKDCEKYNVDGGVKEEVEVVGV